MQIARLATNELESVGTQRPLRTSMNQPRSDKTKQFRAGLVLTLLGLSGCLPSEFDIEVAARDPNDSPLTNLEIVALPFDRDALRDSLVQASGPVRPEFPDLEAGLLSYERPDISRLVESLQPWQAIYDSVRHLADSLQIAGSDGSASYATAYDRLRQQYRRLAQSTAERDNAIRDQVGADKALALRVGAAADSLRDWEGSALASYPALADSAIARSGREPQRSSTDSNGVASFTLEPGRWWFVAVWTDTQNPFTEYYWNVSLSVRLIGARSIPLHRDNAETRWRY